MGIEGVVKLCKDRLVDLLHHPWKASSSASQTSKHRRRRKPLSTTEISDTGHRCAFLNRLPGEIRNTIYTLVLGNRHLSIRGVGQSLPPRRITHEEDPLPRSSNKLALLQTCRQIYQEAAGILYSSNDFEVPSIGQIQAFNRFTEIVSPTRLACMRTMTLICEVSYFRPFDTWASESFAYWKKLWSTMCVHMSALRHLKVQLKNLWACQGLKMTLNSYWVKPMLHLRDLDSFELLVEPGDIVAPQSYAHLQMIGEAESLATRVQLLRRHLKQQLCSPS